MIDGESEHAPALPVESRAQKIEVRNHLAYNGVAGGLFWRRRWLSFATGSFSTSQNFLDHLARLFINHRTERSERRLGVRRGDAERLAETYDVHVQLVG